MNLFLKNIIKVLIFFTVICLFSTLIIKDSANSKFFVKNKKEDNNSLYTSLISHKNIIYKKNLSDKPLKLDIFLPKTAKSNKFNTIIFIHGGSFIRGDKKDVLKATRRHTIPKLVEAGYGVVSVEYTLINDENKFPENIIDILDAFIWIHNNGAKYNLNTENIGLFGTSAGGSLAILASEFLDDSDYSPNLSIYNHKLSNKNLLPQVDYIIDLAAPTKLDDYFKSKPIDNLDKLSFYSPLQCDFSPKIPILIFHGDSDTVVNIQDSVNLVNKLDANNICYEYYVINGANHGLIPSSIEVKKSITNKTLHFVNKHSQSN